MTEGKGKDVDPSPPEDRMDRLERVLERVVDVMILRENLQHGNPRKKPRKESVKSGSAIGTSNHPAKCPECKKYHRGVCFRKTGACYKCGQQGHHIRNCLRGSIVSKVLLLPTRAEDGLHNKIQLAETLHKLPTQEEGFDRALGAKEDLEKSKRKANFKEEGLQVGNPSKKQGTESTGVGSSRRNNNRSKQCPSCSRRHEGICFRATGACFRCGQKGHLMKNCPRGTTGSGTPATSTRGLSQGSAPQTDAGRRQAKTFAVVSGDPQNMESVVSGTLLLDGHLAYVLMDSGPTYLYVSADFASKLLRPLVLLGYEICVSQLMSSAMLCSTVYKECDIVVGDVHYP